MTARMRRLVWTALAGLAGLTAGCIGGSIGHIMPRPSSYPFLAEYAPLPHHVPKYEGGLSFRFAMAHDVIHERFARHGPAHYRERNRLTRAKLDELPADDPATFPLADDLAAGLDRLGQSDEAVAVMRDKLARQQAAGLAGRDLYTSYANLGTFLIHGNFLEALAGDAAARERFREGVGFIRRSVEVNPEAHFGREQWQAAIAEFLLAAMDDPSLLTTFDCLGNRLDLDLGIILDTGWNWASATPYGRATTPELRRGVAEYQFPDLFPSADQLDDPARWEELQSYREYITRVGAEEGWEKLHFSSHREPVPFDEPVLGIIGMWRQGGGANPHFALALGETLLRVGQRYIAWAAFERAARMAERYWPDPAIQQALRDHCRKRQADIVLTLEHLHPGTDTTLPSLPPLGGLGPPDAEEMARLREEFEAELAHGEGYQRAYQKYEEEKLAAGVPLAAPDFFDDFHEGREPIASPVGPEEWFAYAPLPKISTYASRRRWSWAVFGAGLAALAMALLLRWRAGRRTEPVTEHAAPQLD